MQDKNKNNLLDKLAATSWGVRAGPPKKKTIMRSPGGPTQKKNKKIFLVVVAHLVEARNVQIQPIYCGGSK